MIERVHIIEDWSRMGHRVIIRGRPHPGAPAHYLDGKGEWHPIHEAAYAEPSPDIGFVLPEGALDAIVQEWLKVAPPNTATERHLADVTKDKDRLLEALVDLVNGKLGKRG